MASTEELVAPEFLPPKLVDYSTVTGIPEEFNDYLPKDSDEYKRWKVAKQTGAVEGDMANLSVGGSTAPAVDGAQDGSKPPSATTAAATEPKSSKKGSKKSKEDPQILLEKNTRNKKKCITTISGLDLFGVKLNEASKLFGKKFASGCAVVKTAEGKEQIDCQGDFLDQAVELILKQFKQVKKKDVYYMEGKKKERYFDDDDDAAE